MATSSAQLFIGAKEVNVIDGYAKSAGINKFDLAIDWGWFYFSPNHYFLLLITCLDYVETLVGLLFY